MKHPVFSCPCCTPSGLGRREFLRGIIGLSVGAAVVASGAGTLLAAPETTYEAMLLSCIDPRMVEPVHNYMLGRGMKGKYSQFIFAGAAIGVVAPAFADWRPAFWGNLAATIKLQQIPKVIAIDHRQCGAARIAYGDDAVKDREAETATHRKAMAEFRAEVARRHPDLQVETGLMSFDGEIEMFTS